MILAHLIAILATVFTLHPGDTANCVSAPVPTATMTATATPAPTPAQCITITSPASDSTVKGTIDIETADTCPGAYFESLFIDGQSSGSFPVGTVSYDTTKLSNGNHLFKVTSQSMNPGSLVLGSDSRNYTVQNATAPTPSPTPKARMFISSSGTYDGGGAQIAGFDIAAANVTVRHWDITTQQNGNNGFGVYVHGGARNVTIANNHIHDLCREGVMMDNSVSYVTVSENLIERAQTAGVYVAGSYGTVQGNEISHTQQYPRRAGGIFAGCTEISNSDADGIRFAGNHHLISGNYEHDIDYGTTVNPNPHVDCVQTWNPADDITFRRNRCEWGLKADGVQIGQIGMIEGLNGPVTNLKVDHNLFQNTYAGLQIGKNVTTLLFDNNTVDHVAMEAVIFTNAATPTSSSRLAQNIIFDSGGGGDDYVTSLVPQLVDNLCRMRNGKACGTWPVNAPAISDDPRFVSNGSGNQPWTNADYHLQASTPVPNHGAFPRGSTQGTTTYKHHRHRQKS